MKYSKEERRIQEEKEVIEELGEIKGLKKLNRADISDFKVMLWSSLMAYGFLAHHLLIPVITSIRLGKELNIVFLHARIIFLIFTFISIIRFYYKVNKNVKERVSVRKERIERIEHQEKLESLELQ